MKFLESMRIERKFRKMLLERSGEERLKMGCSMYATAQALACCFFTFIAPTLSLKGEIELHRP